MLTSESYRHALRLIDALQKGNPEDGTREALILIECAKACAEFESRYCPMMKPGSNGLQEFRRLQRAL